MVKAPTSATIDSAPLYPPIAATSAGHLDVGNGHKIYIEESGNPQGIPVVFIHGGPGSGTKPKHRQFFDPQKYRIILFDQRGCGQSQYADALQANTTWDLVADMEKIRAHFGIDQWLLFGGSWGSTLGLAYAQTHPERCLGLILRGIFMGRQSEIDWLYSTHGAAQFYPDQVNAFLQLIPESERTDLLASYAKRLFRSDPEVHLPAAQAWTAWEYGLSNFIPNPVLEPIDPAICLPFARLECHYFSNQCFFEDNQLINNAYKIAHLPTILIQGRYDMVCPPITAWELHQALPNSTLEWIQAGHHSSDTPLAQALVAAADTFARQAQK